MNDPPAAGWRARVLGDLALVANLPRILPPGKALYINATAAAELETPPAVLRVRYYHQDHLGSSSVMTDADGMLVEETAFHSFGTPRYEYRLRHLEEEYKFTQKERDRESGLHFFEARYLAARLSRFTKADPKFASPDILAPDRLSVFLSSPQQMNLYSYALNNPLKYTDPTGLEVWIPFVDPLDELDVGQTVINLSGPVGNAAARVSNFVAGTDFDTRSLLAQGVTMATGSETAGTAVETGVEIVAGAGGPRQALKAGAAFLRNPVGTAKAVWGALRQDVSLFFKRAPVKGSSAPPVVNNSLARARTINTGEAALADTASAGASASRTASSSSASWTAQQSRNAQLLDANYNHIMNQINAYQRAYGRAPPQSLVNQFIAEADEVIGPVDHLLP
jgi:RHS repeat-associated protein